MDKRRTSNHPGSSRYARKFHHDKKPERQYRGGNPEVLRRRRRKKLKRQRKERVHTLRYFGSDNTSCALTGDSKNQQAVSRS